MIGKSDAHYEIEGTRIPKVPQHFKVALAVSLPGDVQLSQFAQVKKKNNQVYFSPMAFLLLITVKYQSTSL